MSIEFSSKLIRTLKGAPLSCLLLLKLAGQPVMAEYLERNSGYTDKPVLSALRLLEEYGLITHNERYAWQIADGARQLPLMNLLDEQKEPASVSESALTENEIIEDKSDYFSGTRNNSDTELFRVPSSSRSINLDLKLVKDQGPLPDLEQDDPEKFRVIENLAACDDAGIQEPTRTALSGQANVTARLIRYHVQTAPNLALAIYRIKHGWKIKKGWNYTLPESVKVEFLNVCPISTGAGAPKSCSEPELPADIIQVWERTKSALEAQLRRVDFETWVKPARLRGFDAGGYTLSVGNEFAAHKIETIALEKIKELLGDNVRVTWEGER